MDVKDCKFCCRPGLSLLPLRLALVPEITASTLPATLTPQARLPEVRYKTGHLALRLITTGYVYQYDARAGGFWRCFAATPSGHFREYPVDQTPAEAPHFSCARTGHSAAAALINVQNAGSAGDVWVGYFRTRLSFAARRRLKTDASLRDRYMVKFNAASVLTGGNVPTDAGVRISSGEQLAAACKEYADEGTCTRTNVLYTTNTSTPGQPRPGEANALVARMQANSPNNAIVLALPDVIGMAQDANQFRNYRAGELAAWQADPQRVREHAVGKLILDLEAGMKKNGQAQTWQERFQPKVDIKKVRDTRNSYEAKVKEFSQLIEQASEDWCTIAGSTLFEGAWQHYDGMDPALGKDIGAQLERDFNECTCGSGATKQEQAWWDQWLAADPNDKHHPLWLALAAGDTRVVDVLTGKAFAPFGMDDAVDATAKLREQELAERLKKAQKDLNKWLEERLANQLQRLHQPASGALALTIGSQLQRVAAQAGGRETALVTGMRLRIVVASRMDVTITLHAAAVRVETLIQQQFEAMYGPPRAQLSRVTREATSLRVAQGVDGAWLGNRFQSTRELVFDVWLPDEAAELGRVKLPAGPTALLPAPAVTEALNPWRGMAEYMKTLKNAGGGLMGLSLVFQLTNLNSGLTELDRARNAPRDREKLTTEAWAGIISGSLGIVAVGAEMYAGVVTATAPKTLAKHLANPIAIRAALWRVGGSLLGAIAAITDGYLAIRKAMGLFEDVDDDAGSAYAWAGFAFVIGGGAVLAQTLVVSGAALATAGATSTVASAIIAAGSFLSVIPVWGWIVLAVGSIGVALYSAFRGGQLQDTPIEKWLSRCHYRSSAYTSTSRIPYSDLTAEMKEFQLAIYGIQVTLDWSDEFGKDGVDLQVTMPGFKQGVSDYAYLLALKNSKGVRTIVNRRTSPHSKDLDLKPQPPEQHYVSAVDPRRKVVRMEEVFDVTESNQLRTNESHTVLSGKLRVNEDYFAKVALKLEYWPDPKHLSKLCLIPIPPSTEWQPDKKTVKAIPGTNTVEVAD